MQFQFLEGPPPGGFSFCYVIGFPSNIGEHRNGRTPESDGPSKKCVGRIGPQQARHVEECAPLLPPMGRIGREGLRRMGMRMYAIGVDKSGLLVRQERKAAEFRPHKTAAKKLLRPLPESARVRWSDHRSCRASVLRRPASAGFLFLRS